MDYTTEAYSLFHHNCNHFTNDFATFLTGSGIPVYLLYPKPVLCTLTCPAVVFGFGTQYLC